MEIKNIIEEKQIQKIWSKYLDIYAYFGRTKKPCQIVVYHGDKATKYIVREKDMIMSD